MFDLLGAAALVFVQQLGECERGTQEGVAELWRSRAKRPAHADVHTRATAPLTWLTRRGSVVGPSPAIRPRVCQDADFSGRYMENRVFLTDRGRFWQTTAECGCDIRLISTKPTTGEGVRTWHYET